MSLHKSRQLQSNLDSQFWARKTKQAVISGIHTLYVQQVHVYWYVRNEVSGQLPPSHSDDSVYGSSVNTLFLVHGTGALVRVVVGPHRYVNVMLLSGVQ